MSFIDIFNYKKYFKKSSDAQVARIGHVNALYDALSNSGSKFTVDTGTVSIFSSVTVDADAGSIALAAPAGGGQGNFTVNNNKVTASSIILLTFEVDNAFAQPTQPFGASTYSITDGSFGITFARPSSPTPSPINLTFHFLVINP
jgi:hypothetical protein